MERNEWIGLIMLAVIAYLGYQSLQLIGVIDEEGEQFERTCEEHGGTVVSGGSGCEVTHGGHAYAVPIDPLEDTFDTEQARYNRQLCASQKIDPKDETRFLLKGETLTLDKYVYHPESGVCETRENAVTLRGRWEPPKPVRRPSPTSQDCAEGYTPCVPPYPPDVDCDDVGAVVVTGDDPHGLDDDGDGRACGAD